MQRDAMSLLQQTNKPFAANETNLCKMMKFVLCIIHTFVYIPNEGIYGSVPEENSK